MNRVILALTVGVIAKAQCESDLSVNDRRIVQGIAAKIGSSPTVLKVFIKGDVPAEEIEKLLNLCVREEKGPNDTDLTRNRRNSMSNYIGKLYSFSNLFRPYRSIFRRFKHSQTTRIPWLKRFLGGVQEDSKTENFWGMALGAHTFSPFARPIAQTRMPYHRIRDQQRIEKLLGLTRTYGNVLANYGEQKRYHGLKTQESSVKFVGLARSEEKTTAINDRNNNATTRRAFHRAPLDVAGLKSSFHPLLRARTTRRRLKFCEKQCADEPEEATTRQPQPASIREQPEDGTNSSDQSPDECETTESCASSINRCPNDEADTERKCKGKCSNNAEPGSEIAKNMAHAKHSKLKTKLTTLKMTTSKFTKYKVHRPTGPVWTLMPNSILDRESTANEQRSPLPSTAENKIPLKSTLEYTTIAASHEAVRPAFGASNERGTGLKSTCKPKDTEKHVMCVPMPVPTRIKLPLCPSTLKPTRRCTIPTLDKCDCQARNLTPETMQITHRDSSKGHCRKHDKCHDKPNTTRRCTKPPPSVCDSHGGDRSSEDMSISIGDSLECHNKKPNDCKEGKPQKIIVRISSSLGEVPVVIMRDNGVPGVSLTLVNDYLLDENNRLIKCLGKPVGERMDLNSLNSSVQPAPRSKKYKSEKFLPPSIRQKLYGMQPKQYSSRFRSKPNHKLIAKPCGSLRTDDLVKILEPFMYRNAFSSSGISNHPRSKFDSPDPNLENPGSFALQYPAIQNPRVYQGFKMEQAESPKARLNQLGIPIPQMGIEGYPRRNYLIPTQRFRSQSGVDSDGSLAVLRPSGMNLQPVIPPQVSDMSQLMGYRSPFLPLFYRNTNVVRPQKYIISGLP